MVETLPSNAVGVGSIPAQGTKVPHASWPENQNKNQKQYCNKLKKKNLIIKNIHSSNLIRFGRHMIKRSNCFRVCKFCLLIFCTPLLWVSIESCPPAQPQQSHKRPVCFTGNSISALWSIPLCPLGTDLF